MLAGSESAGPLMTDPSVARNREPWQGHVTTDIRPAGNRQPMCVQIASCAVTDVAVRRQIMM